MRGRKPIPTRLKILRGNPGKRPLPTDEPIAPQLSPGDAPSELSRGGKRQWAALAPLLVEAGLLTKLDAPLLAGLCETLSRQRTAQKELDATGLLIVTRHGVVVSPAERIVRSCAALALRQMSEIGLTPSSRVRLRVEKPPAPPDAIARRFFERRRCADREGSDGRGHVGDNEPAQ